MAYKSVADRNVAERRRRKANPEKHKAAAKAKRDKVAADPERRDRRNAARRRYQQTPAGKAQRMIERARYNAKAAGVPCDLVCADILPLPAYCPVLGVKLDYERAGVAAPHSPSLDKLDPRKGYVKGNVNVISYRANRIKNDAGAAELKAVADWVAQQESLRELLS